MIDPRNCAVLIRHSATGEFEDQTAEISDVSSSPQQIAVRYLRHGPHGKTYPYGPARAVVVTDLQRVPVPEGSLIEVRGEVWKNATEAWRFAAPDGSWVRVFYVVKDGEERFSRFREDQVRVIRDGAGGPRARDVLSYLRRVVDGLGEDDPLRPVYRSLDFVHPESALARYLQAAPPTESAPPGSSLLPFSSNLSQRHALALALEHPICVIEGPPGTGKTQTILNIIATLVGAAEPSVAIVSSNNAAVDNVRDKLTAAGFGFVAAGLGRKERRAEFFAAQAERNAAVDLFRAGAREASEPTQDIDELTARLDEVQQTQRQLAQAQHELAAHMHEQQRFLQSLEDGHVAEMAEIPLMRRPSQRILDYLAETQFRPRPEGLLARPFSAVRRFLRYGPLRGVDASDSDAALRLQEAYYVRRIAELTAEIDRFTALLSPSDPDALVEEHRRLSSAAFTESLHQRYAARVPREYTPESYRQRFGEFIHDYPVILSTCHSLRRSIPDGHLMDYLVIDEASQVDLPTAAAAMACCRNLIVVGDVKQLGHIVDEHAAESAGPAPDPAYDYREHSILSSLIQLYGPALPRTMLREHYRCDPEIIGFCNEKFYDGQLIPFTHPSPGSRPLILFRAPEGSHMRTHLGGGRTNERERDIVIDEVIPEYCADLAPEDIGITSPYRRQVGKLLDRLDDGFEADTVHRFQGRQKKAVIMSTVVDDTWRGRSGIPFVDDPRMVNVAVSRAVERFVLVTDHNMLPTSRHLRDLMGYVAYHDPEHDVIDSQVVSIFDLLYRHYSKRLDALAGRVRNRSRYPSENIARAAIEDILADPRYDGLHLASQVLLRNLLPDLDDLTPEQEQYVRHRASVDFVVVNSVTRRPLLAIEVDGFAFHENDPAQTARDRIKDAILAAHRLPLLRLATTGSGEDQRIRAELDRRLSAGGAIPPIG
ncbi:MAG TPA: AAA domain-containing protein [Gryllotalpicola sp.]